MNWQSLTCVDSLTEEQRLRVLEPAQRDRSLDERWGDYGKMYGHGATGSDPVERAKQSIRMRLGQLRELICKDLEIGKMAESPEAGVILSLAFMVTGKLVANHFHDVDVVQLGALIAQLGVIRLCKEEI